VTEGKNTSSSLTLLYDTIRWEEKAIYEAAKKKGIEIKKIDCKDIVLDLNTFSSEYTNQTIIQRCVSYFKNLHSTAALEGL
jgi:[lysine-biosynthesis-protein LysW]--L-2-aminoadipate ligase